MKIISRISVFPAFMFLSLTLLFSCKKEVQLGIGPLDENVVIEAENCKVSSLTRTKGLTFQVSYNGDLLKEMLNYSNFDKFIYDGNLLKSAVKTTDKSSIFLFEFNNAGNLTSLTFKGADSSGKPTNSSTLMSYDNANNLVKIDLSLPGLAAVIELAYDQKGNITTIKRRLGNGTETLLENKSFDDKHSPFLDQKLGQILTYFMVSTLILGDDNYSYFLNKNNVTSSVITNDQGRTELSVEYTYNTKDYPTKADIAKNKEGRISKVVETFSYTCI
jgi:hypothetical protein